MSEPLRLMCILAHPDDETLGLGGILSKYANEGIETYLVTATRGERGWFGDETDYPGSEALGRTREAELCAAAEALGLQEVTLLDYPDGELDRADPQEVIGQLVAHVRRVRPHVIVTFDPYGVYGHPDHIAISQFATAAVVAAADPDYADATPPTQGGARAHRTLKLYYFVETREDLDMYEEIFGDLVMDVNGQERRGPGWVDWAITTRVDTAACWARVWQAIRCHRSQLPGYQALLDLPQAQRRGLWEMQKFYRVMSLVNGGREQETDLFQGLREPALNEKG